MATQQVNPIHIEATNYGTTIEIANSLSHSTPAKQTRQIWDYRAAGLTVDAARKWLQRVHDLSRRNKPNPGRRVCNDVLLYQSLSRQSRLDAMRRKRAADIIPASWCQVRRAQTAESSSRIGLSYERQAEWDEPYKPGRHRWPSRRYDILTVTIYGRIMPVLSADGAEITIGPWTYRKNRGHSLAVRYNPQGGDLDAQAFAAESNAERRTAIINACGEDLRDLFAPRLVQADDYGKLYDLLSPDERHNYGRFVRVVCPSTDRVYWLGVSPDCQTAHEAVAATFGLTPTEYNPVVQC